MLGPWFSNWAEIHAFILGILAAILIAALWHDHRYSALALLGFSLLGLTGPTPAYDVTAVHKPWYYLAGLVPLVALRAIHVSPLAAPREPQVSLQKLRR